MSGSASGSSPRRLRAVALADVVVFMLDGRAGLGPGDREAIALIRETGRPMVAAINKMDRAGHGSRGRRVSCAGRLADAARVGGPRTRSRGVARRSRRAPARARRRAVRAARFEARAHRPPQRRESRRCSIASSGFERAIVDDTPGTTRDPVDVRLRAADRDVLLIDTAGIRRPAQGRRRARASFGRPRDRDDPPRRSGGAGDRFDRGRHRPGRASGAAGRTAAIARWSWSATSGTSRRSRGASVAAFVRDAHERCRF